MGQLRDIEASRTYKNYGVDPDQTSSSIVDSGLGTELTFSGKGDPVSDLEKSLGEVFSNTKHPEIDPEEALSDTNDHGCRTVLHGGDEPPEHLTQILEIELDLTVIPAAVPVEVKM